MIGGEFGRLDLCMESQDQSAPDPTVRFAMSGRSAMYLIIEDILSKKKIHKVYMPSYCSRSMIDPIVENGLEVEFYHVLFDGSQITYKYDYDHNCDCVVLMDYFGYCSNETPFIATEEQKNGRIVIIDMTQSLLCDRDYDSFADYTFSSYRKWFPSCVAKVKAKVPFSIPHIYSINTKFEMLRNAAFQRIMKSDYPLELLLDAEEVLHTDYKHYIASNAEVLYANQLDFDYMKKVRRTNAEYLTSLFVENPSKDYQLLFSEVKKIDCPLYVPILIYNQNREQVIEELEKLNIISYVHWTMGKHHNTKYKNDILYTSELSLFCDQRYDSTDMDYIFSSFLSVINK